MQLLKTLGMLAGATLFATVDAAPTSGWGAPTTRNVASPGAILLARDSNNDCGDSSFVDQTSTGSPSVNDCLQIAANIAGGGTWEVECTVGYQHQLVQYGSCAFGVQCASDQSGLLYFYVGNQDIIDLIHSSVDMYSWNGLVGSEGEMPCGSDYVNWGLY